MGWNKFKGVLLGINVSCLREGQELARKFGECCFLGGLVVACSVVCNPSGYNALLHLFKLLNTVTVSVQDEEKCKVRLKHKFHKMNSWCKMRERRGERGCSRIFEEPSCREGRYLNCTGRESRVIHGMSKNEMFAKCADWFLDRSITKCLKRNQG